MTPGCSIDESWERRWGIPEWEPENVTICIAAMCENGKALILCGDAEVGVGFTATELGKAKWGPFGPGWNIGISGTVSHAVEVISWGTKLGPKSPSNSLFDVKSLLENCYRKARLSKAEGEYLASRGWTLQDWIDSGRAKMPEATYANIDARIALFDFGADLIAAGWGDDDDIASIITVKNPGVCADHTRLGFWCVGSGSTAAQMSLFSRNYSPEISLEQAAYYVMEAKISAERAAGVGRRTDMFLTRKDLRLPIAIRPSTSEAMRVIWEQISQREFGKAHQEQLVKHDAFEEFRAAKKKVVEKTS